MLTEQRAVRWMLSAFVIGAIVGQGRFCRAGASDAAKVEQLIREGNALRRNHQDARALPMFQQAYELSRTPRTAAQLGLAELALGYWDAANEHITDGLTSGRNTWVDENRAVLEAALKEAKSHLASVTVDGSPAGAEVFVNGKSVGRLPLPEPAPVIEGRIEIEVRAPAYKSDHRVLTVQGHSSVQIRVDLQSLASLADKTAAHPVDASPPLAAPNDENQTRAVPPSEKGPDTEPAASVPTWRRVLPWALAAAAIGAGGLGAWQAVDASHSLTQFNAVPNSACGADDPNHGSDPRCKGLYDDWTGHRTKAWAGFGTAGVLAAGAVTLFIWNASVTPVDVQVGMGTARVAFRSTF